jgi:hypothetical protein
MALAGNTVVAYAAKWDSQTSSGTTTSTTYTASLAGGTACGVAFIAPPSGAVAIFNTTDRNNSSAALYAICGVEVREGDSIGSGTHVAGPTVAGSTDDKSNYGLGYIERSATHYVVDTLTPGASYNARQLFRVNSASTGTFIRKELLVLPMP